MVRCLNFLTSGDAGWFQGAGEVLGQYDEEGAQFHMFDLPDELLQILPEGCRTIGKVTCVLIPNYAGIMFDTLTGRNDGKGYNFIVVVALYDSDSQNEHVSERIELENLVLKMELDKLNKGIHPKHGEKLTGIKIKEWGAGGSFNYMDEWDGKKMVVIPVIKGPGGGCLFHPGSRWRRYISSGESGRQVGFTGGEQPDLPIA